MNNKLTSFGEPYKLTAKEKKVRVLRYALSLVTFQEVGAGADENLKDVKNVASTIQNLCFIETGINLESYPIDYLNKNFNKVLELLPYKIKQTIDRLNILDKLK